MDRKKLLRIIAVVGLIILVFIVVGRGVWFGSSGDELPVIVAKVIPVNLAETVAATGKIQPEVEVKITSEVSGEVIELPIKEGQQVEKGALLVRINPDLYESAIQRAEASQKNASSALDQAKASFRETRLNYRRSKTLFKKGVISRSEWDKVISAYGVAKANSESAFYNVESASATVNEAQKNLERTEIYAPIAGTISMLAIELGERVVGTQQMAGTDLIRLANLNLMEVEVDVNENDIVKVAIGDTAQVEVDAYFKKNFQGIVTSIANSAADDLSANQVTNFKVKVRVLKDSYADLLVGKPENYAPFRPGMTATVSVITDQRKEVLAVPISAIVIKNDTTAAAKNEMVSPMDSDAEIQLGGDIESYECVFVKDGDHALLKVVQTGIQDDYNIEVLRGLDPGDEVIIGPYNTVTKLLQPGDQVTLELPETR